MSHFGSQLAAVLDVEELSQVEFAHQVGLQATYLNRLLKTSRPISPATAGRIIEVVPRKHRAALLTAFLEDAVEQLEQTRGSTRSRDSVPYFKLVSITERSAAAALPPRVQQRLNAFAKFAETDSTPIRALEAFLEALIRSKS